MTVFDENCRINFRPLPKISFFLIVYLEKEGYKIKFDGEFFYSFIHGIQNYNLFKQITLI